MNEGVSSQRKSIADYEGLCLFSSLFMPYCTWQVIALQCLSSGRPSFSPTEVIVDVMDPAEERKRGPVSCHEYIEYGSFIVLTHLEDGLSLHQALLQTQGILPNSTDKVRSLAYLFWSSMCQAIGSLYFEHNAMRVHLMPNTTWL